MEGWSTCIYVCEYKRTHKLNPLLFLKDTCSFQNKGKRKAKRGAGEREEKEEEGNETKFINVYLQRNFTIITKFKYLICNIKRYMFCHKIYFLFS